MSIASTSSVVAGASGQSMRLQAAEVEQFFHLFGGLLGFCNRQLNVLPREVTAKNLRTLPSDEIAKLRDACYAHAEVLEQFLKENPEGLPQEELEIVAGWRHRLSGRFIVVRHLQKYSVFLDDRKPGRLYGVLGLYSTIDEILSRAPLPTLVEATLLPFRDRIITDGLLRSYSVHLGSGIRDNVNRTYSQIKARDGIIVKLGPGGNPLSAEKPRRQVGRDFGPQLAEIAMQVDRMRGAETPTQQAALSLLRASVALAQAAFNQPDEQEKCLIQIRRSLSRLERLLDAP